MNLSTKLVFTLLLVSVLSACATTKNISIQDKQQELVGFELPKADEAGDSYVYVVRPDSVGFAVRFKVYIDGKRDEGTYVGYTRGKQYLAFPVSVGKHTIYSKAENWASVDIDAKEEGTIFLKQTPSMGLLFARNNLEEIGEVDGKYFMKKMELNPGSYIEDDEEQDE